MKETIKSLQAIAEPFWAFLRWEGSSGVMRLACAILALIVANSPLAESYEHLLHYPIAIGAGEYVLSLLHILRCRRANPWRYRGWTGYYK